MTAVSPYAPTGRNAFLRPHNGEASSRGTKAWLRSASLALLLLAVRFWNMPAMQRFRSMMRVDCLLDANQRQQLLESDQGRAWIKRGKELREMARRVVEASLGRLKSLRGRQERRPPQSTADVDLSASRYDNDTNTGLRGPSRKTLENYQRISSILKYWFGQYTPEISQKKLWMIAASSHEHRKRVDREITESFEGIVCELVESQENGLWYDLCHDSQIYGYQGKVAAIVALDQFSRHIRRYREENATSMNKLSLSSQTILDSLAHRTAELFSIQHKDEIECGMIPVPMYVFALMPYRHASTIESVKVVQSRIEGTAGREEQMNALIRRFRNATNRRLAILQDEARRTGETEHEASGFADEDILEAFPFEADMTLAHKHIVLKTVQSFLKKQIYVSSKTSKTAPLNTNRDEFTHVIVSLSGGVDSMVIASVLSHLSHTSGHNLHIVAVHIDYANRPESDAEADYVRRYCARLGIEFKCRRIDEVTRGVTARDDYERIARDVRYGIYRDTVKECQEVSHDSTAEVGVMLGHHRGDLRENVLSNSHKGCGPLDLSGMAPLSRNDGVVIYRPLLPLEKKEILDYAHTFGVPYFKDTTPHWSTRGKLRGKLLPLLEEIYGEGSMKHLSTLATESDDARELLMQTILNPFLDNVERTPMGLIFETAPWRDQDIFFWKFVLRETLHRAGLGMFSEKSVIAFLERVQVDKVRSGWLQCRRDYAVYLGGHGKVFVLFPDSFPLRHSDQFDCWGNAVSFGIENAVSVGPWTIHAEVANATELLHKDASVLERKAIPSMEEFMKGYVQYYVKMPADTSKGPRPLVFVREFKCHNRPRAWKGGDLKLQATLPILGSEEGASIESVDRGEWILAKVALKREGVATDC